MASWEEGPSLGVDFGKVFCDSDLERWWDKQSRADREMPRLKNPVSMRSLCKRLQKSLFSYPLH
jgi:hypothetical protein